MGDAGQVLSLQHDISPRKPPATWPWRPSVLRTINLSLPRPSHRLPPSHLYPGALCLSLSLSLPSFLHPGGGKVPRPCRRGNSAPHHGNTQRQESPAREQTERRSPSCGVRGSGVPSSAPPLKLDQLIHLVCVLSCRLLFAAPGTAAHRLPCPWNCPSKNTGAVSHFLLQAIFLTHPSCTGKQIIHHPCHLGVPNSSCCASVSLSAKWI